MFELKELNLKSILKIDVNYKQVGSDRLANAISVSNKKDKNFIILDFGTATTFDVLIKIIIKVELFHQVLNFHLILYLIKHL